MGYFRESFCIEAIKVKLKFTGSANESYLLGFLGKFL